MTVTTDQVLNALKVVQDPDLKKDLVALGFIKSLKALFSSATSFINLLWR